MSQGLLTSVTLTFIVVLCGLILPRVQIFSKALFEFFEFIEFRYSGLRGFITRFRLFTNAWIAYLHRPRVLFGSLLLSFGYQFVALLIILSISSQIGITVELKEWLWVFAIVSMAVIIPLTIGGIGIREGAFVMVLGLLGVSAESALIVSISMFALQVLAASLGFIFEIIGIKR
jgi:uncharacterized membrane protein YbhN (UPF0104 family)